MTPGQQQKILNVIAEDANGAGSLYRPAQAPFRYEPEYCVLGGLALAAGWDNDTITGVVSKGGYGPSGLWDLLATTYGLTQGQAKHLMGTNDRYVHIDARRRALSKMVRAFDTQVTTPT